MSKQHLLVLSNSYATIEIMSRGPGALQREILFALLESSTVDTIQRWFPLYSPGVEGYVLKTSSDRIEEGFGQPLRRIDKLIKASDNPYSIRSSLRRAARALEANGQLEALVCGASYFTDPYTEAMRSHPTLCVRFGNTNRSNKAIRWKNRIDYEEQAKRSQEELRERVLSKLQAQRERHRSGSD